MQIYRFSTTDDIPFVEALILGPLSPRRVRLVFDTGAGVSQLDTGIVEELGYSASTGLGLMSVQGPAGDFQEGYLIKVDAIHVLGKVFTSHVVGVYDFDNFSRYGVDGLLGFDIIKQLHLEMIGPTGVLKVY